MKLLACVYVCVSFVIWQISLPFNVNYGMPKMKLHEVFVQYLTSLLCVCVCVCVCVVCVCVFCVVFCVCVCVCFCLCVCMWVCVCLGVWSRLNLVCLFVL